MTEVILTVGPRASGKSTFCMEAVQFDPSITLVSRDALLVEMFGSTDINPYTGGHHYAAERMWEAMGEKLRLGSNPRIILDAWNESKRERSSIIRKLRALGADQACAWYFVTPVEYVQQWFWQKPGIAKMSEMKTLPRGEITFYMDDAPKRNWKIFHQLAKGINSEGFNDVVRINPLTTTPEQVLTT